MIKRELLKQTVDSQFSQADVDAAAIIFVAHTEKALIEMNQQGVDIIAGVQAIIQMSMRTYADLISDDLEAIAQVRGFLDGWEQEVFALM